MSEKIDTTLTAILSTAVFWMFAYFIVRPLFIKIADYIERWEEIKRVKLNIENFKELSWEDREVYLIKFLSCREQPWETARDFLIQAVTIDVRMMGLFRFLCEDWLDEWEKRQKRLAKKKQQESKDKAAK